MLNIVFKEFAVQRTAIVVYFAIALLMVTQLIPAEGPLAAVSMLAMLFTFSTIACDDRNNVHILMNSLPVSRKEIVTAKYLFHLAVGLSLVLFAVILGGIFGESTLNLALWQTLIAVLVITSFVSVFFPLYYWLGARFVLTAMFALFFAMLTAVPIVSNLGARNNYWGIFDLTASLPTWPLVAGLTTGTLVHMLVSWRVSVWLYRRKEF